MSEFFYQNKFGSIKIAFDNNIMITEFTGPVSASLVDYLIKTTDTLFENIEIKPWGYISHSTEVEAATPDGYKLLVEAAKKMGLYGCVKSAYVLTSPIAIAQTEHLRVACGVTAPITDVLFDELEQAKQFITDFLENDNPSNT
jgi:hypothetical protein